MMIASFAAPCLLLTLLIKTFLTSSADVSNCSTLHNPDACNGDSGVGYNVTAYCINTTAIHVYYRIVSDGGDVDLLTMQYTCYINQTEYTHSFVDESEEFDNSYVLTNPLFSESSYCIITGCTKRARKQCWQFIRTQSQNKFNVSCALESTVTTQMASSLPLSSNGEQSSSSAGRAPVSSPSSEPSSHTTSISKSSLPSHKSLPSSWPSFTDTISSVVEEIPIRTTTTVIPVLSHQSVTKTIPSVSSIFPGTSAMPLSLPISNNEVSHAPKPSSELLKEVVVTSIVTSSISVGPLSRDIVSTLSVAAASSVHDHTRNQVVQSSSNETIIISFSFFIGILAFTSLASWIALIVLSIFLKRLYKRINTSSPAGVTNALYLCNKEVAESAHAEIYTSVH